MDKVQGHAVPLKSELTTPLAGTASPYVWKYEVKSVEFGKEYPESTFWPTIQPGVDVLDTLTLKRYKTPGQQPPAPDAKQGQPTTSQAVQVSVPKGWTDVISGVTLGLGVALLVAVGLYRWRRG